MRANDESRRRRLRSGADGRGHTWPEHTGADKQVPSGWTRLGGCAIVGRPHRKGHSETLAGRDGASAFVEDWRELSGRQGGDV